MHHTRRAWRGPHLRARREPAHASIWRPPEGLHNQPAWGPHLRAPTESSVRPGLKCPRNPEATPGRLTEMTEIQALTCGPRQSPREPSERVEPSSEAPHLLRLVPSPEGALRRKDRSNLVPHLRALTTPKPLT